MSIDPRDIAALHEANVSLWTDMESFWQQFGGEPVPVTPDGDAQPEKIAAWTAWFAERGYRNFVIVFNPSTHKLDLKPMRQGEG